MKKSILVGLGACALALGGVAALIGQKGAVETKADGDWWPAVYETNPSRSVNKDTDRYWFAADPNASSFWDSTPNMGIWVMYEDAGNNKAYLCSQYVNNAKADLDTIYYFDLPKDAVGFIMLRLDSTWGEDKGEYHYQKVWNQSADLNRSNVSKTAMNYLKLDGSSVTVSQNKYTGAAPWTLKEVLTEFPTCSTSQSEVMDLYDNFWAGKVASVESYTVSNTYLDADYNYADYLDNEKSYDGLSFGGTTPSVQEKWESLCHYASVNPTTGDAILAAQKQSILVAADASAGYLILGVSLASAFGIGSMMLLRRRKKKQEE